MSDPSDDFDPVAYIAEKKKETQEFDPKAYLEEAKVNRGYSSPTEGFPVKNEPEYGGVDSRSMKGTALRHFGDGGSFGFGSEISGLMGANDEYGRRVRSALGASGNQSAPVENEKLPLADALMARYRRERDDNERELKEGRNKHHVIAAGSSLAGSLVAPIPGPGSHVGKTVLRRAGEYGLAGGALGGLNALGNSNADLTKGEVSEALKDTGSGALVGAGFSSIAGPTAEYLGSRYIKPWLQNKAETNAVGAIAPNAGLANRLRKKHGIASDEEISEFGRDVLDANVLRPFGTAGGALGRTEELMGAEGAKIGDITSAADELATKGTGLPYNVDSSREAVSRRIRKSADVPALQAEAPAVEKKLLDRVGGDQSLLPNPNDATRWDDNMSYGAAWKNKSILQKALKIDEFSKPAEQLYRQGVAGYTSDLYNQIEAQVGPEVADALRSSAKKYGTAAKIEDLLRELNSRNQQRSSIGLMDTQVGQVAGDALKGVSPYAGAAATGLSSLLRGRMDSTIALGANRLAKTPTASFAGRMGRVASGAMNAKHQKDQRDEEAIQAWLDAN